MEKKLCQGTTSKGAPCKRAATTGDYCYLHQTESEPVSRYMDDMSSTDVPETAVEEQAQPQEQEQEDQADQEQETTKTFEAIVNAGATLVNLLDTAIDQTPTVMDKLFKYSVAKMLMPEFSDKMQQLATDNMREQLQKWQANFINLGSDPAKLDQLLEQTRALEAMTISAMTAGERYLPVSLKEELQRALRELEKLTKAQRNR